MKALHAMVLTLGLFATANAAWCAEPLAFCVETGEVQLLERLSANAQLIERIEVDYTSTEAEGKERLRALLKRRAYVHAADFITGVETHSEQLDRWHYLHVGSADAYLCRQGTLARAFGDGVPSARSDPANSYAQAGLVQ
ncbi:hypothetical protein [Lysobacter silvisoli]|uniref:Uncharacterized protein n=1 Tax=Lysobacter silvisoli TaxID=2293254 RepID=A0A371K0D9_9GAMM|nr:hypothetical protein [Lysobacter silvisoli]RDZ27307.1 hypothetical protein DX914_13775 [Lysobacter silvisoli]